MVGDRRRGLRAVLVEVHLHGAAGRDDEVGEAEGIGDQRALGRRGADAPVHILVRVEGMVLRRGRVPDEHVEGGAGRIVVKRRSLKSIGR